VGAYAAPEVYLLGSGIKSVLHFTVETIQALKVCRTLFVLHDDRMVHDFLKQHCSDVRDLAELYPDVGFRSEVYEKIANVVVGEAANGGSIAFLVHGHPLFLVSAAELLINLLRARNILVHLLPGVSSFDTIMCDLAIDYAYGIQIFDATTMISRGWRLNASLPALVFQIATTMNGGIQREMPAASILQPLVEHIAQSHQLHQRCAVIHSASFVLDVNEILWMPVGELTLRTDLELWRRPTLYIPARL
jgi:uncharacterized protein YabN with tetrapyrrole methylase and pyrophosphatase domain